MFIVRLKPWDERTENEDGINAVINEIYRRTDDISSAQIMAFAQPMIPGYGVSSGFEIYIQDQKGGSVEDLLKYTRQMIDALNARPEIGRASTSFDTKYPQYLVEVDAALCKRNGVSPSDVLSTLSGYIGGNYGFGGMRVRDGVLSFDPQLPAAWESLSFKVNFQDRVLTVRITRNAVEVANEGAPVELEIRGVRRLIADKVIMNCEL